MPQRASQRGFSSRNRRLVNNPGKALTVGIHQFRTRITSAVLHSSTFVSKRGNCTMISLISGEGGIGAGLHTPGFFAVASLRNRQPLTQETAHSMPSEYCSWCRHHRPRSANHSEKSKYSRPIGHAERQYSFASSEIALILAKFGVSGVSH